MPYPEDEDDEEEENGSVGLPIPAMLDGIDVAIGFQSLFADIKTKKVYIHDIDQALARSSVILLDEEGTESQKPHFREKILIQVREKALAKWQDTEAMDGRNQVRAWLDPHEDHGYDCTKSLKHISDSAPLDSKVFMTLIRKRNPDDRAAAPKVGRNLALEIKNGSNKTACEVGVGEVTSHAKKNHKEKNAKDLVRVGLSLKEPWTLSRMRMAFTTLSLSELGTISTQIKIWNDLRATVEQGLSPVLAAVPSGKGRVSGTVDPLGSVHARVETARTPSSKPF
ncbi:hypothetical protein BGZ47_011758 [Haplosporangium gracile]|nr:hypothetical protein BGZ47_011758 [Haplosporangium gracile]